VVAAQQFPKGQLTAVIFGRPLVEVWERPVARIIPFEPGADRDFRALRRGPKRFLSPTKRLHFLRDDKVRASPSPTRKRYLAQAEEYRFQAEAFGDPKTQAQMLRSAAICEHWAMQADE